MSEIALIRSRKTAQRPVPHLLPEFVVVLSSTANLRATRASQLMK